jgi:hypothetical protein
MKPKWRRRKKKKKRKIFGKNRTKGWSYEERTKKKRDKSRQGRRIRKKKGAASDANMGVSYI